MTRIVTMLIIFICIGSSYAYDDRVVELLQVSSSGRTIYLDRGANDGVKEDEYAVLMLREEKELGRFVFKPAAKLRSLKTLSNQSVWVAYQVFIPSVLVPRAKLLLLSESNLLKGRTDLSVKRTQLVTQNNPAEEVKDFLLEGDSLSKKKQDYKVIEETKGKEAHQNKDIDLLDVERYEDRYGDGRLFISGIYKSPYAEDFTRRKRVHKFEKMVVAFFKKFNDPSFDPSKYIENMDTNAANMNVYDRNQKNNLKDYNKRKKLFANLRKKGARWSKEYSDNELGDILEAMDTDYEIERRRTLLAYNFEYQAFASFGLNLINNENINDPETTQQSKYDIEIGAESYFFKRFRELKSFTVEISGRRALDAFFGGELNARSTEYSVAAHVNWYPFRRPSTIHANIFYIGTLIRYGFSFLENVTNNERGNYQVFGLPGIRGGFKYNFSSKFGVRVTAGLEELRVERIVRDNDIGTLPDRTRYFDGKVAVGLSRFF